MASEAADDSNTSHEKVRMQLLEKALQKTTGKCVSSFKQSLLKQHFKPVYKKDSQMLLQLHEGAVKELGAKIQEELAVMFEEENISSFMVQLDELRSQSDGSGTDAWRPSGCPADDVRAHLQSVRCQHLKQLNKVLDQLQSQHSLLRQSVEQKHEKVKQSQAAIEEYLHSWQQVDCLKQEDRQQLEKFVKTYGQGGAIAS